MSVDSAVSVTQDKLSQGWLDWDVSKGDLDAINREVANLTPAERNEFIGKLSNDDIKNWTQEIDGAMGSLSAGERGELFNRLAEGLDGPQTTRFVEAFDGSSGGLEAFADAIASHGSSDAKTAFIGAVKGDIDGEYKATQGTWGNSETEAAGKVLASLANDPQAFQQAVGSLSKEQLQDVMNVAMGRKYIVDFTGRTAGTTQYEPSVLTGILNAAQGADLPTRTAVFEAAMPQLKTMQGDNVGLLGAEPYVDGVAQAMGKVLSRDEAVEAGLLKIPEAPAGVSMDANIADTHKHEFPNPGDMVWFKDQVQGGGPWDYKTQGAQYENYGNFHFGVVAAAMDIPEQIGLRGAGYVQIQSDTSQDGWGKPYDLGDSSYGDDPRDQAQIKAGYDYYNSGMWRVWAD
ncbi:polymorphic toxin type 44 domain-containing protein [Lysobacter sp. Hz 25]|uniref:polymorphic toxin type 44 domain-containing protein n=1 Tax=Lysobacter sp. Hz 25 TaxID=3383698 RepID=UPI0038D49E82